MDREGDFRGPVERPFPIDAPRRKYRKKATKADDVEQTATIGILATAVSAIFIPLSIPLGPHWALSDNEAFTLAESLQKALSTLPGSTYADLKKYLDRFIPWIALTIVIGQTIAPKIELTQRIREAERAGFPDSIETAPPGNVDPAVWQRPNVDGDGSQTGNADPFGSFPGTD